MRQSYDFFEYACSYAEKIYDASAHSWVYMYITRSVHNNIVLGSEIVRTVMLDSMYLNLALTCILKIMHTRHHGVIATCCQNERRK